MDCLFCKIINGEIPCKKVYEDDNVLAFEDINPVAPVHILFVPKVHIANASGIDLKNSRYVAEIFVVIAKVADEKGLTNGYRVVNNCGEDGGQTVHHLHFHLIGGRKLDLKMC